MGWLYVPGSEDWNLDSNSPLAKTTTAAVTLRGKHSLRPASWRGWKTRPWTKPLFTTLLNPSLAISTAERWTSSLPDSRASHGVRPAKGKARRTLGGSGPPSGIPFARYNPNSSTWKMSQRSFEGESQESSQPWPSSGSMRNGECFQRLPLDVPRSGSGSLYWATIRATDLQRGTGPRERARRTRFLPLQIKDWYGDQQVTPNLDFVESLQGLPIGWTDGELSATRWSHWLRLMRSELLRLEQN